VNDVREVMLDKEIYDILLVNEIMNPNFQTIDINSEINTVLKIFNDEKVWNIAVTQNSKFVGFISKSNLFNKYISLWHEQRENEI
jgi:CIC family chloride channel protein